MNNQNTDRETKHWYYLLRIRKWGRYITGNFNFVSDLRRYVYYKKLYPDSYIAFGVHIRGRSTLGMHLKINRHSYIFNSILSDNVTISSGSVISNVTSEENAFVYRGCYLSDIEVGRFSYVGMNSRVSRTSIGRFCSIGPQLLCGLGEHPVNFVSTSPVFYSTLKQCGTSFADKNYFEELKNIVIGHDVWIGARVFIRDGVNIGNGVIIGSGSVVVSDLPDYAIVGGVPAKIIKYRFDDDIISKMLEIQWWNWSTEKLLQARNYFVQNDVQLFVEWAQAHRHIS